MAKPDPDAQKKLHEQIGSASASIASSEKESFRLKIKINHVLELMGEEPRFQLNATDVACQATTSSDIKNAFLKYKHMNEAQRRDVLGRLNDSLFQTEAEIRAYKANIATFRQRLGDAENRTSSVKAAEFETPKKKIETPKKKKDALHNVTHESEKIGTDSDQTPQKKTTTLTPPLKTPKARNQTVAKTSAGFKHEFSQHVVKTVAAGVILMLIASGFGFWYHSTQQQFRHELELERLKTTASDIRTALDKRIDDVNTSIAGLSKSIHERHNALKQDIEKSFKRFEESNKLITLNNQGWVEKFADSTNRQYKDLVSLQDKQLSKQFDSLNGIVAEIQKSQKQIQTTTENNKKRTEFLLKQLESIKKILEEIRASPTSANFRLLNSNSWIWIKSQAFPNSAISSSDSPSPLP